VRDETGQPAGRWAIVRDVTERKRAEQAMQESERRERTRTADLLALMDAAPVAIFMAHDPECRQMSGNRFMTDVFRLPPGANPSVVLPDGRKQNFKLMRNGVDIPVAELPVRNAARTGRPVRNYEMDLVLDNGVSVNLVGDAVPVVDEAGLPRGAVGVFVDMTERKRADDALRESNRKLQQLSRDLLRTQDYERRRIARELHDSTSQLLAALNMILSRLRDPKVAADRRSQMLSEASELAAACCAEIRTVTYLLHPPLLEEIGLTAALQAYATGFNQRTGIEVEVKIRPDFGRLGSERESTLFRIVQEGLANVHKHSGSPSAIIRLERDSHEARLILQDYGRGFPTTLQEPATGFVRFGVGIMGMRERAEQLGGRVEFTSSGEGTRLTVILPLVQSNEEDANSFS
jgi:signal transduction histidine kinase